jgi:hypothetical protein
MSQAQNPAYTGWPRFTFQEEMALCDMSKPCPCCENEMELGSVSLGQTMGGFLVAGLALPHLFFHSAQHGKLSALDWKTPDPPAYRCSECGTVVLLGKID